MGLGNFDQTDHQKFPFQKLFIKFNIVAHSWNRGGGGGDAGKPPDSAEERAALKEEGGAGRCRIKAAYPIAGSLRKPLFLPQMMMLLLVVVVR